MIDKVLKSVRIVYGKNTSFLEMQELLIHHPNLAMVSEISEALATQAHLPQYSGMRCEDPSKQILILLYILKFDPDKIIKAQKGEQIFIAVLQECMGRFINRN